MVLAVAGRLGYNETSRARPAFPIENRKDFVIL